MKNGFFTWFAILLVCSLSGMGMSMLGTYPIYHRQCPDVFEEFATRVQWELAARMEKEHSEGNIGFPATDSECAWAWKRGWRPKKSNDVRFNNLPLYDFNPPNINPEEFRRWRDLTPAERTRIYDEVIQPGHEQVMD
jgi:hypothetical protein